MPWNEINVTIVSQNVNTKNHTWTHLQILLPSGFVGCIDVVRLKKGRDVNVLEVWSGDELLDAGVLLLEGPVTILLPGEDIAVGCWINVSCPSVINKPRKRMKILIDL